MDSSIGDDAWKDSFDKLLEPRPVLRQLNIIKKDVRASFNIDSSVENSKNEDSNRSNSFGQINLYHKQNNPVHGANKRNYNSISTPLVNRLTLNPFCCPISPIGAWKIDLIGRQHSVKDAEQSISASSIKNHEEIENIGNPEINIQKLGPRKRVCFETPQKTLGEQEYEISLSNKSAPDHQQGNSSKDIFLQPGKWRKSLCQWRRTQLLDTKQAHNIENVNTSQHPVELVNVVRVSGKRKSTFNKAVRISKRPSRISNNWAREILKHCGQKTPLPFKKLIVSTETENYCKIGEGVYGEVFIKRILNPKEVKSVLKIIPIEGSQEVNGEVQKTFEQILPEIIISKELSCLREDLKENRTFGFVEINKMTLVKGRYPEILIKLWEDYDKKKCSENDHPEIFVESQLFLVMELEFAGDDLSNFVFSNAEQSYFVLNQIVLTLAAAEAEMQFEHRDLHWGNVLITKTSQKFFNYKLQSKPFSVPSKGVKATIIDYTLSRMSFNDCCLYNDLSSDDELFEAKGDYQFDIYRMMKKVLQNNWATFEPKTNVFWISYIISKMMEGVHYKNIQSRIHKAYMQKLKTLSEKVMTYQSAVDCVTYFEKGI